MASHTGQVVTFVTTSSTGEKEESLWVWAARAGYSRQFGTPNVRNYALRTDQLATRSLKWLIDNVLTDTALKILE